LAKDWENLNRKALVFLCLASIRLILRKLCNPLNFPDRLFMGAALYYQDMPNAIAEAEFKMLAADERQMLGRHDDQIAPTASSIKATVFDPGEPTWPDFTWSLCGVRGKLGSRRRRRQLRPCFRNPSVKLKHPGVDLAPFRWL